MADQQTKEALEIIRLKKGGQRFEVACYPEKVKLWKEQEISDVSNVLKVVTVFKNYSKSILPKNGDLKKMFKTTKEEEVCRQILNKGKTVPCVKKEVQSESKTHISEEEASWFSFWSWRGSQSMLEWFWRYIWPKAQSQGKPDKEETINHAEEIETEFMTDSSEEEISISEVLSRARRSLEFLRKSMLPKAHRQQVLEETYQKVCQMIVSSSDEMRNYVFEVYAHFPASNMRKYMDVRDSVLLVKTALYNSKLRMKEEKGHTLSMDVFVEPAKIESFLYAVIRGHGKVEIIAMVTSDEGKKQGLPPYEAYRKAVYRVEILAAPSLHPVH